MHIPNNHPGVLAALGAWLLMAIGLTVSAVLASYPRLVGVAILSLTLSGALLYRVSTSLREFIAALDLRVLLLFHVIRAPIGIGFLLFHSRGLLPGEFAL